MFENKEGEGEGGSVQIAFSIFSYSPPLLYKTLCLNAGKVVIVLTIWCLVFCHLGRIFKP